MCESGFPIKSASELSPWHNKKIIWCKAQAYNPTNDQSH
jgi:hypothetical protein